MKTKIDKADKLFSFYIRTRDKWTCQRCGEKHEERSQGLHNSHYWGRGRESTRFSETNCAAICLGCHRYFHAYPQEYYKWKLNQLGEKEFQKLEVSANMRCRKDRKLSYLFAKQLLKKLEKKRGENYYPDGIVRV